MSRLPLVLLPLALGGACLPSRPPAAPACVLPDLPLAVAIGELELPPGGADTLRVRTMGPGVAEPVPPTCPTRWGVEAGAPASIDDAGVLRLAADAPDGRAFRVVATVGDERVEQVVRVVDRAASPLVGLWSQVAWRRCEPEAADEPSPDPIRELRFRRDGTFEVTWLPFERYVDYWGTYRLDDGGRLTLAVDHGNRVPASYDLDLSGRVALRGDTLVLDSLWLGRSDERMPNGCGLTFRRAGRPADA